MKKRLSRIVLCAALGLSALPALIPAGAALAAGTDTLTVTKYAADGVTVVSTTTLSITDLQGMTVQGDGTTHYFMQGPTFVPGDLWNPAEDLNLKDKGAVRGTDVKDLCELVGGAIAGDEVNIKASDGYNETFLYDDVYNPEAEQGKFVICWEKDGVTVPTFDEGMQLVFFADDNVFGNQDMHDYLPEDNWHYYYQDSILYPSCNGISIKYIDEIRIYSGEAPDWDLQLDGAVSETMSKDDFESGVACHGEVSYDDGTNTWSGMPLWLLIGRIDDDNIHGPDSYNDELADAGYTITVTAGDGYSRDFDSATVKRNNDFIVCNKIDGELIAEGDGAYPLKLMGPAVSGGDKVGNITNISISGLPWTLELDGEMDTILSQSDFETAAAANPVNWDDTANSELWEGLALWRLVAMIDDNDPNTFNSDLAAEGYDIKVIASDGYSKTFASADVADNDDMIIANVLNSAELVDDAPLKLVGPDLTSGQKVGMIVEIQLLNMPTGNNSLTATANVTLPTVGIWVDRESIDYGDVGPGESSDIEAVGITNIGTLMCDVTVEVLGSDSIAQDFYEQSLFVDDTLYDIADIIATIPVTDDTSVDTQLTVPENWNHPGAQEAMFIFWAEETP